MSLKIKALLALLFIFTTGVLYAQTAGNSPYSSFGVGDLHSPGFISNTAMGGIGVSFANGLSINNLNPALLSRNKNTIFDVGMFFHQKALTQGDRSQQVRSGNLNYLAFAFPASPRWTLGISLMPYSRVDYISQTRGLLFRTATDFNIVDFTVQGSGGISKASITNGVDLGHGFAVGLQSSFLFGVTNKEYVSQIYTGSSNYRIVFSERTNVADFLFKPGFAYRQKLKEKLYMNAGATFSFATKLNAKRLSTQQTRNTSDIAIIIDTLEFNQKGSINLPTQYQVGLSLESPYHWTIGVDFTRQQWSQFSNFGTNGTLGDSYTVAVGGELTPNIQSVSSYFKRATYRLGANYSLLPVVVNGKQLEDQSISLGTSLPIGRGISDLNLAFVLGQRGLNTPIKEQYFKVFIGFTLRDQWFVKRKID